MDTERIEGMELNVFHRLAKASFKKFTYIKDEKVAIHYGDVSVINKNKRYMEAVMMRHLDGVFTPKSVSMIKDVHPFFGSPGLGLLFECSFAGCDDFVSSFKIYFDEPMDIWVDQKDGLWKLVEPNDSDYEADAEPEK